MHETGECWKWQYELERDKKQSWKKTDIKCYIELTAPNDSTLQIKYPNKGPER